MKFFAVPSRLIFQHLSNQLPSSSEANLNSNKPKKNPSFFADREKGAGTMKEANNGELNRQKLISFLEKSFDTEDDTSILPQIGQFTNILMEKYPSFAADLNKLFEQAEKENPSIIPALQTELSAIFFQYQSDVSKAKEGGDDNISETGAVYLTFRSIKQLLKVKIVGNKLSDCMSKPDSKSNRKNPLEAFISDKLVAGSLEKYFKTDFFKTEKLYELLEKTEGKYDAKKIFNIINANFKGAEELNDSVYKKIYIEIITYLETLIPAKPKVETENKKGYNPDTFLGKFLYKMAEALIKKEKSNDPKQQDSVQDPDQRKQEADAHIEETFPDPSESEQAEIMARRDEIIEAHRDQIDSFMAREDLNLKTWDNDREEVVSDYIEMVSKIVQEINPGAPQFIMDEIKEGLMKPEVTLKKFMDAMGKDFGYTPEEVDEFLANNR